jgi:REP element-mobilizing transposase RayT/ribosomal protein S18 acetylase RimI-like enzyme
MHLVEGELYHVYNRGNNKQAIFFTESNYSYFLEGVKRFLLPYCDLLAWCLMPNHFHFLIHANEKSVVVVKDGSFARQQFSQGIKQLLSAYTKSINKAEGRTGSLFQQKTKAVHLVSADHPATVFHYIHQNPVRAGLVDRMEQWAHSSFNDYYQSRESICHKELASKLLPVNFHRFYEESKGVLHLKGVGHLKGHLKGAEHLKGHPSILRALPDDAPELSALVNAAYRGDTSRQGWTTEADLIEGTRTDAELLKEVIEKPGSMILKYVEDEKIIGCVELRKEGNKLYLGMLTVNPVIQGKGIGKALLKASEEEARRQQCRAIFMNVLTVRKELIDWYIRHGYHDTGSRKPFAFTDPRFGFPKQPLEFMIMEKEIT